MKIIKSFSLLSQYPLQWSVLAEKASQDEKIIIQFLTSKSEKLASTRMRIEFAQNMPLLFNIRSSSNILPDLSITGCFSSYLRLQTHSFEIQGFQGSNAKTAENVQAPL